MRQTDLAAVAALVVELNREPSAHCIHSWAGESVDDVAAELTAMFDKGELTYVVAELDGEIVGGLACEHDLELGRGWVQGPHVRSNWHELAERLHDSLRSALPTEIVQLAAYVNVANDRGRDFYASHGYVEDCVRHHEFKLELEAGDERRVDLPRLEVAQRASFFELFEATFPKAYYSHERLLEMQGSSHEMFVTGEGDRVDGFVVAYCSAGQHRGEIQFVAVREDRRRRGLGRKLLECGIGWLNSVGVREVALNVADTRTGARRLYDQVGFRLRHSGVGLKLSASKDL